MKWLVGGIISADRFSRDIVIRVQCNCQREEGTVWEVSSLRVLIRMFMRSLRSANSNICVYVDVRVARNIYREKPAAKATNYDKMPYKKLEN